MCATRYGTVPIIPFICKQTAHVHVCDSIWCSNVTKGCGTARSAEYRYFGQWINGADCECPMNCKNWNCRNTRQHECADHLNSKFLFSIENWNCYCCWQIYRKLTIQFLWPIRNFHRILIVSSFDTNMSTSFTNDIISHATSWTSYKFRWENRKTYSNWISVWSKLALLLNDSPYETWTCEHQRPKYSVLFDHNIIQHLMSLFHSHRLFDKVALKNLRLFCLCSHGMHTFFVRFFLLLFACAVDALIEQSLCYVCAFQLNVNDSVHSLTYEEHARFYLEYEEH